MKEKLLELSLKRKIENEEVLNLKQYLNLFDDRLELFKVSNLYSQQMFSKYPEDLICKQLEGTKNRKRSRIGDFNCEKYGNVEYKYSIVRNENKHGRFLQLRPNHNVDFYIFDIYFEDSYKLHTFLLSKNQLTIELKDNSHLTHGSNDRRNVSIDVEYSIDMNKERFEKWCRLYRM